MPMILLNHWRTGLAALILLAFGFQTFRLAECRRHLEKVETRLAKANVLIEIQNEQVARLEEDGRRLIAKVEQARRAGEAGMAAARAQAAAIRSTPANGCPTPLAVMEAYR